MAVLYTPRQIQDALKELRIKPIEGMVSTNEATRILSWRAKTEHGVEHTYNVSAIRRHVQMGNLVKTNPESTRLNKYRVEDIFDLPLAPKRGQRQAGEILPSVA